MLLPDIGVRCVSASHFDTGNSQVREDAVGQDAGEVLLSSYTE